MAQKKTGVAVLPLHNDLGQVMAELHLWPTKEEKDPQAKTSSLFLLDHSLAEQSGEREIQLRERERYEYEIRVPKDSQTRYALKELPGIRRSLRADNAGTIETRDATGVMLLELVDEENDTVALAHNEVEVRSRKLSYRDDYRAMLDRIAAKVWLPRALSHLASIPRQCSVILGWWRRHLERRSPQCRWAL